MTTQYTADTQQPTSEHVVAPVAAEQITRESQVEEDGVDWCAWWAEYAEMME
jgi:hypothetical protein